MELQLSQIENPQSFSDFQRRRREFRPDEGTPRPNRRVLDDVRNKVNAPATAEIGDYLEARHRPRSYQPSS